MRAGTGPQGASIACDTRMSGLWTSPRRRSWHHLASVFAFAASAAGSSVAKNADRPRTAVIIFLLGVIVCAGIEGVWGGLLAAVAASLIFNCFLIEPSSGFSLATSDDYVPIVAFNVGAVAAGMLTGRLKDRVLAAERATSRVSALLALSERLQAAVDLPQMLDAIRAFVEPADTAVELYLRWGDDLEPVDGSGLQRDFASTLSTGAQPFLRQGSRSGFQIASAGAPIGVLVFDWQDAAYEAPSDEDLGALVSLVSIAMERCLLLQRVSEAELVRKSEEFKTALLSSVSHDMRTPLGAISASATSLVSYGHDLPESARRDLLSTIQEQCQRLNIYTTKLLSLGRLQAGLDRQQFSVCDPLEVLGLAIAQARALGGDHPIDKEIDAREVLVRADPVMLEQVFYNLLENSVRYSEPGTLITVSAKARQGRLLISVRDIGQGIPPAEFERIFHRFYRLRDATGESGSGLGLAIAKGFTEAFGGRIWAGVPGDHQGGTIMTVELSLVEPEEVPA